VFGGEACCTYKLHIVARHLMDQVVCQGAGAGWAEFWVERMVGEAKRTVHGVREAPEASYASSKMLFSAADRCRTQYPQLCQTTQEWAQSARMRAFPQYDDGSGGYTTVQLLGCRKRMQPEECEFVASQLAKLLQLGTQEEGQNSYNAMGWPTVPTQDDLPNLTCLMLEMQEAGSMCLDKFTKATVTSLDILNCDQDNSCWATDNRWFYICYLHPSKPVLRCIGRVKYFVRARVCMGGMACFSEDECVRHGVRVPRDAEGNMTEAQPLRLAVVDLFLAEVCVADTVGCDVPTEATGELPALMLISNLSTAGPKLPDNPEVVNIRAGGSRYFGQYLIDVAEIQTQMVPTKVLSVRKKETRYFMSAHKASSH
jgi:hypothetical protein